MRVKPFQTPWGCVLEIAALEELFIIIMILASCLPLRLYLPESAVHLLYCLPVKVAVSCLYLNPRISGCFVYLRFSGWCLARPLCISMYLYGTNGFLILCSKPFSYLLITYFEFLTYLFVYCKSSIS